MTHFNFEEWHDSLDPSYSNLNHCPHIEWERLAWNAAIEMAAQLAEEGQVHSGERGNDLYTRQNIASAIRELLSQRGR